MRRRDFLKSTATIIGGAALGPSFQTGPAAAEDTPVKGGTLIWGHSETTQNLDIHQTGTASTVRVLQNVHDAIVTVDKNLTVIPSLAQSFEQSPDLLTYTFHLRPGVKFHNGKPMTSADVKYSFDRVHDKATGAVNFEVFNDVAAIETPDDLTVVIKMNRVNAPFLSRLAENGAGAIIPQGSGEQQGKAPIGAGPFKFVRREFGHEVELARFDDYWGGPASAEAQPQLEWAMKYDANNIAAHLNLGDCHRLNGRIPEAKKEFEWVLLKDASLAQAHYDLALLYLFAPSIPGMNRSDRPTKRSRRSPSTNRSEAVSLPVSPTTPTSC